ncbi:hypothetical protein P4T04_16820 [Bacillus badius]|uniref:hypothetical protein n=1 Tax=Bacillus badius TaxID=1455 RepID=UPI002E1C1509|nr:hypothetical protein [Bacillus badius]
MEEADHLRHHEEVKPIYVKRKETIERVFADAGDAYFRCHESQENSQLDLAGAENGLNNGVGEVYLSLKWLENHLKNRKGFGMRSFRTPFADKLSQYLPKGAGYLRPAIDFSFIQ